MWPEASPVVGVAAPAWDPLVDDGGLREAELLDVRVDPGRSTVGLILGLKGWESPDGSDTGVLVARRVQRLAWSVEGTDLPRLGGRFARYVVDQSWSSSEDQHVLCLGLLMDVELGITALDFNFYEVDLEGGPYDIPDYGELDDAAIHAQQPNWNSRYRLRTWLQHTTQGMSL